MDMFAHWMRKPLNKSTLEMHFLKQFWMDNWKENEGYQSSHTMLRRTILSAGLSDNQLPIYRNYILSKFTNGTTSVFHTVPFLKHFTCFKMGYQLTLLNMGMRLRIFCLQMSLKNALWGSICGHDHWFEHIFRFHWLSYYDIVYKGMWPTERRHCWMGWSRLTIMHTNVTVD